jgi:hypothetical protein
MALGTLTGALGTSPIVTLPGTVIRFLTSKKELAPARSLRSRTSARTDSFNPYRHRVAQDAGSGSGATMPYKSRDEWSVSPSLPALCAPWPRFLSHRSLSKVYCLNSFRRAVATEREAPGCFAESLCVVALGSSCFAPPPPNLSVAGADWFRLFFPPSFLPHKLASRRDRVMLVSRRDTGTVPRQQEAVERIAGGSGKKSVVRRGVSLSNGRKRHSRNTKPSGRP